MIFVCDTPADPDGDTPALEATAQNGSARTQHPRQRDININYFFLLFLAEQKKMTCALQPDRVLGAAAAALCMCPMWRHIVYSRRATFWEDNARGQLGRSDAKRKKKENLA
nr:hypothetical protein [Pandoravirus aubagnensis]